MHATVADDPGVCCSKVLLSAAQAALPVGPQWLTQCCLCLQGGPGGAAAGGADAAGGAAGGFNPAMLASMLSGLGAAGGGSGAGSGAAGGAAGLPAAGPGMEGLMGMFQNAMQMGGMGGMGGFGAQAPVADPATHFATQIQQLQVSAGLDLIPHQY